MFSTVVDVAIGLIFVYLLLSLMCSAANEIIELLLKKRAIDLERGIRELLAPGTSSGDNGIVRDLYNHPLINNLFGKRYENSRIGNKLVRKIWRTRLPSYIPARSFALALMDLLTAPAPAADASPPISSPPISSLPAGAVAIPPPSGATGSTPPGNFEVKLTVPPPPPLSLYDTRNPLKRLREAIATNVLLAPVEPLLLDVRPGLIALVDAAGDDVAKARENIETWFNNSMDRVSSWYKRRTQVVILLLGLFVAVVTNADSIAIANKLSTDKALRESLVAASMEYAKAHASPEETQTGSGNTTGGGGRQEGPTPSASPTEGPTASPTPTPCPSPAVTPPPAHIPEACKDLTSEDCTKGVSDFIPECKTDPKSDACKTKAQELLADCASDPKSDACKHARILLVIPECVADRDSRACKEKAVLASIPACNECKPGKDPKESPKCKYEFNQRQLDALNLPIGWGSVDDIQRKWPGRTWRGPGGWWAQIQWHVLGWLLTALAVSLGAPFWFDLLNKFIVIRSAVKPHEKSPEEESKD